MFWKLFQHNIYKYKISEFNINEDECLNKKMFHI